MENIEIGKRLKFVRKQARIKQTHLAQLCGLSRASIANIESGKQACSLKNLLIYSKATGVSVDTILENDAPLVFPSTAFDLPIELHNKLDKVEEKKLRAFLKYLASA